MKRIVTLCLLIAAVKCAQSQYLKTKIDAPDKLVKTDAAIKSQELQAEYIGFRNPPSVDRNWQPYLFSMVSKNESEDEEELNKIKEKKNKMKLSSSRGENNENSTQTLSPTIGVNFMGID